MKNVIIMKNQEMNNNAKVFGTVSNTPEVKLTSSGKLRASFRLVSFEKSKNEFGEIQNSKIWRNVVAWGKQAEFVQKTMSVGRKVCLDCVERNASYTDSTGKEKNVQEFLLNRVLHLGDNKKSVIKVGSDC